jgi:predicted nucleic acid-binding protein
MMVVDASVVAKWFVPEPGSREAIALQSGPHNLIAPASIRFGVADAICRAAGGASPCLSNADAKELCERWFKAIEQHNLELIPDESLLQEACGLAVSLDLPLADCLYVELASRWNIPLVTASRSLRDRVVGRFSKVRLLKGIDTPPGPTTALVD